MRVGFIGLGRMGQGMARRILGAGHELSVFDMVAAQTAPSDGRCAGGVVDRGFVFGSRGRRHDARRGQGGPRRRPRSRWAVRVARPRRDSPRHGHARVATVRQLESRHRDAGQVLVAAPVLGRPDLAAAGQLGIVAGGPEDAVRRCEPLLSVMGRKTFPAGAKPESATAIKLANNAVLGCAMVAMAEGFSLVRKYGVAPQVFQDVMTEGLFSAPAYKVYGQKMVDESYDQVGSPIHVGLKDANLIASAADLARVPMPSHNVYHDRLLGAVAHGDGDRDQAVLAREQARASGLE